MYRAILPEGQVVCERYDSGENGVELFDEDDRLVAFVPYANLHAILDEEAYESDERSIM